MTAVGRHTTYSPSGRPPCKKVAAALCVPAPGEIAAAIIAAKGFPDACHPAVTKMVVARLGVLAKRGEIAKTGKTRDARWAVNSN